jgi:hypothetical protein
MDVIAEEYSQEGNALPFFAGYQYGSGWLKTLGRMAFPLIKRALGALTNTAKDVLVDDKTFVKSLANNATSALTKHVSSSINKRAKKRKQEQAKVYQ